MPSTDLIKILPDDSTGYQASIVYLRKERVSRVMTSFRSQHQVAIQSTAVFTTLHQLHFTATELVADWFREAVTYSM